MYTKKKIFSVSLALISKEQIAFQGYQIKDDSVQNQFEIDCKMKKNKKYDI